MLSDTQQHKYNPLIVARDAISRFLGTPTGNADSQVAELTTAEVAEIAAAAADKQTARAIIKTVLSRANDRRQTAAAEEAPQREQSWRRLSLARAVLENLGGLPSAAAEGVVKHLTAEDLDALLACKTKQDVEDAMQLAEQARSDREALAAAEKEEQIAAKQAASSAPSATITITHMEVTDPSIEVAADGSAE
jgi:hypothetical protein